MFVTNVNIFKKILIKNLFYNWFLIFILNFSMILLYLSILHHNHFIILVHPYLNCTNHIWIVLNMFVNLILRKMSSVLLLTTIVLIVDWLIFLMYIKMVLIKLILHKVIFLQTLLLVVSFVTLLNVMFCLMILNNWFIQLSCLLKINLIKYLMLHYDIEFIKLKKITRHILSLVLLESKH